MRPDELSRHPAPMETPPPNRLDLDAAEQCLRDEGPNKLGVSLRRAAWDMARDVVRKPKFCC